MAFDAKGKKQDVMHEFNMSQREPLPSKVSQKTSKAKEEEVALEKDPTKWAEKLHVQACFAF